MIFHAKVGKGGINMHVCCQMGPDTIPGTWYAACIWPLLLIGFWVTVMPHPQLVSTSISFARDQDIAYHMVIQWPISYVILLTTQKRHYFKSSVKDLWFISLNEKGLVQWLLFFCRYINLWVTVMDLFNQSQKSKEKQGKINKFKVNIADS